ncbi:hypothetical protein FRC10_008842 [Ceratobasidium sp. 414]|nr:hypothetical protein FRC10_008842 [Ceratobasidium sp. 414]
MSAPNSPPLPFPAEDDEELPGYTRMREPHEHVNSLLNRNGQPWMSLELLSEAPARSKFPVYFNGGTVRGLAHITLESPQTIRSVVVEVRSKLGLATADELSPIWHERKVLWEPGENSQPRSISSAGSWKWGFTFPIPIHFDDTPNGGSASTPLPGSFDLKPYPAFVEYRILLFVKRGKWLPNISELHTLFAYVVRERAPPPSPLRELAYSEHHAPPGPLGDPDGWETGEEITAKGIVFGDREVALVYRAVYSRGGTIFYRIEISGGDPQALQLLSSPSAITVLLTQEARTVPLSRSSQASLGAKGADVDVQAIARGVSWSDTTLLTEPSEMRVLEGEIIVPPKTSPNIKLASFQLQASDSELSFLVTFAINAVGFAPHDRNTMISRHPIRTVSHPALGVAPMSRIPPGYEQNANHDNMKDMGWAVLAIANRTMNRATSFF